MSPANLLWTAFQFTLLGIPSRLVTPWALLVIVPALLGGAVAVWRARRTTRLLQNLAAAHILRRMAPQASSVRPTLSAALSVAGIALLSLAAAQPQCGSSAKPVKRTGMDLVIALDASASMFARDVRPSRIERAKLELSGLIDRLPGDRIGLVVFTGDAYVQCPLTSDHAAAKLFLRAVDPSALPQQGTSIAAALRVAGGLFDNGGPAGTGRAVVVLSDGEDHEGEADEEAKKLSEQGVRIYAIGVGSRAGEPIPLVTPDGQIAGYKKDRAGKTIMTRLNEEALQSLAAAAQGRYVSSNAGDLGMGEIADDLGRLQRGEFETQLAVDYDDKFETFAWPGTLLWLAGIAVGEGVWRRRRKSSPSVASTETTSKVASILLLPLLIVGTGCAVFDPEVPEYRTAIGAFERSAWEEARTAFEQALVVDPAAEGHLGLGAALDRLGRGTEAAEQLRRAAGTDDPTLKQRAYLDLGNAQARTGQLDPAIEDYRRALQLDPSDHDARYNLEWAIRSKKAAEQQKKDGQQQDGKQPSDGQKGDEKKDPSQNGDQKKDDQDKKDGDQKEDQEKKDGEQEKDEQDKKDGESKDGRSPSDPKDGGKDGQQPPPDQPPKDPRTSGQPEPKDGSADGQQPSDPAQKGEPAAQAGASGDKKSDPDPDKTKKRAQAEALLDALRQGEKPLRASQFQGQEGEARVRDPRDKDW